MAANARSFYSARAIFSASDAISKRRARVQFLEVLRQLTVDGE
jgi:hypothetical protein